MNDYVMNRRTALGAALGVSLVPPAWLMALAANEPRPFQIGVCDWSLGLGGNPAAMELAAQIGLDGVEVSFGKPGSRYDLRKEEVRRAYHEAASTHGVRIASLAMGVLNNEPYASVAAAETWVADCVEVMPKLGVKVVLLAFFNRGDILSQPELQRNVIQKLKRIAPRAEQAGVVLGIESWLNAEDHRRILDAVGSPAVQVYYDVANMTERGYDIFKEIRELGRNRICQIHCKENGCVLGQGKIDFLRVKQALDDIGYRGWLIIEGAVPKGQAIHESHLLNQKYLRSVFLRGQSDS